MNNLEQTRALDCTIRAARAVGRTMRQNLRETKKINEQTQHDIKLELDVLSQIKIEKALHAAFPSIAVLGEEGSGGAADAAYRWVLDPIDGTVNFAHGIPHACVSIALQQRVAVSKAKARANPDAAYQSIVGVVYDPFCDELWTAIRGEQARLNGKPIHVSQRRRLNESIVAIGFAKQVETLRVMLPVFNTLIHHVRKFRIMGAAALSLTYLASGRFDAYVESGIRLWDVAAGALILECAGGEFWHRPAEVAHSYRIIANNGLLRREIQKLTPGY